MVSKNYQTAEELVLDETFGEYVRRTRPESIAIWETWLAADPARASLVREASALLLALQIKPQPVPEGLAEAEAARFLEKIKAPPRVVKLNPAGRGWLGPRWAQGLAAAIALLLVAAGVWWLGFRNPLVVYQTAYGQTQQVQLPDGSQVTLNANSRLEFRQHWAADQPRQVWVTGEGFFEVAHRPAQGSAKFIVNAGKVAVEVLGTKFNVFNRQANVKVSLNTGKIRLKVAEPDRTEQVEMTPGDLVEVAKAQTVVRRARVDAEKVSAWKQQQLFLDQTTMHEVARLITENYGYQVHFANQSLANRRLSGSLSLASEAVFFNSLETILGTEISKENQRLIFH
ncbi:MAG: FecR domain-containing protein [Bernardetiaceae bacterium]|jgi:ferric-dicitrate binding protein FerR (iron transport regulator)|nr:FecR domain-containing protein [Bernardetiaceae bacterium]